MEITLIPALIAPLAGAVPGFPMHGRTPMSAATAELLARTVQAARRRPAG